MHFFLPELSSGDIRNKICDYIQNNGALVDGLKTSEIVKMEGHRMSVIILSLNYKLIIFAILTYINIVNDCIIIYNIFYFGL